MRRWLVLVIVPTLVALLALAVNAPAAAGMRSAGWAPDADGSAGDILPPGKSGTVTEHVRTTPRRDGVASFPTAIPFEGVTDVPAGQ